MQSFKKMTDLESGRENGAEATTIPLLPRQPRIDNAFEEFRMNEGSQESQDIPLPTILFGLFSITRNDVLVCEALKDKDLVKLKRELLFEKADLCTALHWCLENYSFEHHHDTTKVVEMDILMTILDACDNPDILDELCHIEGETHVTVLWRAIHRGLLEVVKLLLDKGARMTMVTKSNETALHISTKHPHILKFFLDNYDIENSADVKGYAAIHWAAVYDEVESVKLLLDKFGEEQLTLRTSDKDNEKTPWHKIVDNGSIKVAEFLVETKYLQGLNAKTKDGQTPLYMSASYGYSGLTALLLRTGQNYLSDKANDGKSVVEQLVKNVNAPTELLETTFDEFLYDEDRALCVDYYCLADFEDTSVSKIDVLKEMVRWGQSKILVHPLVESLLCLRWQTLLPVFYGMLVIYSAFLISFNVYLVNVFYKSDTNGNNCSGSANSTAELCSHCYDDWSAWVLMLFIYLSIFLMLAQECIYIYLRKLRYFGHLESWMKLCVFGLGLAVPLLVRCVSPDSSSWPRHVACAALLLAWLQAMLLLSRFPGWGYYVLMLERVSFNVLKVFATAVCLVVGFSLCFMIQYHSQPPFDGPVSAVVKTLVMMSSEFDYEDLLGGEHKELEDAKTKAMVLALFVIFVIFVAVVLMNFMIAVAVSDVNELNLIGNMRRLEKQVEVLSNLEVVGDTVLGEWWKQLSRVRYHYFIANNLECNRKWEVVFIGRNKPENNSQSLPSGMKKALMNVVKKKLEAKKVKKVEEEKNSVLNALYDAVVGLPRTKEADLSVVKPNETPVLYEMIRSLVDDVLSVKKEVNDLKALVKDVNLKLAATNDVCSCRTK